ncbi:MULTISPECIES: hypothetical protein [Nostoc]|uniref:Uncharacterized protein n=2 Tax=Nostoc TaxID=1177 RepID=A0ABR8IIT5_9NOSO|nr:MULTISPECIES: hypothetical protein [Nostoc]MBD2564844.1 hypothetical protein [Nostoc linckia FACHB-391]MBD2651383.1 hypothetical protein [Nostoc foliaceum FACHB-393]
MNKMNPEAIAIFIAAIIGLFSIAWQIRANRMDDKRAAQLHRLDKQLSDLYGPLYALFESGDKQWRAFLREFSSHKNPNWFLGFFPTEEYQFTPPNEEQLRIFRLWTENIFMHTNTRLEETIINNAELIVGKEMPQAFLNFCVHVASVRASAAEWSVPNFEKANWRKHIAIFPHPAGELHNYIVTAFRYLKREQYLLISGLESSVDEQELAREIQESISLNEKDLDQKLKGKVKDLVENKKKRKNNRSNTVAKKRV